MQYIAYFPTAAKARKKQLRNDDMLQPSTREPVLGYLYEFDCKETVGPTDGAWIPIAFKHKVRQSLISVQHIAR